MRHIHTLSLFRVCAGPLAAALLALTACATPPGQAGAYPQAAASSAYQPRPYVRLHHPDWARNAVLYQLNTRQFTPQGTFVAAQAQLPRLKDLGVDIIWLMPVHPIGEKNRKGTLGSPYSVKDFYGVNPEFGTLDDLKAFVAAAHGQGMHVILDWVANHTAWDNPLTEQHPDWYDRNWKGEFHPTPWWDWTDIIDLDYSKPALRKYMADAMAWWVRTADVDGFRCDVAGYVPLDFWVTVRRQLDAIKPVFMLAEFEERDVHAEAFDASYAWTWNNTMHAVAMGQGNAYSLFGYYSGNESAWPQDAYRMTYVSNHDQNAWTGTQFERFGKGLETAIVLSVIGEGMPLIYNGQEAGNEKRLAFFEKDPIRWRQHPIGALYKRLIAIKKANTALWNGAAGARMIPVVNSAPEHVLSFVRRNAQDRVFAVLNLTDRPQTVKFTDGPFMGTYRDAFSGAQVVVGAEAMTLGPWAYRVLVQQGVPQS